MTALTSATTSRATMRYTTMRDSTPLAGLILLGVGVGVTLGGGIFLLSLLDAGRSMPGSPPLLWVPIAMLIAGPVLAQVGLILCAPLLLRVIAWLMRRSRIGARLASQDAARNPGRSVPALAAIMTTIFVAVFAMAMLSSSEQSSRAGYHYSAALGTVHASLIYQDSSSAGPGQTQQYKNPSAVTEAIRSTVSVKEIRTLASVPEPEEVFFPRPDQKLSAAAAAKNYAVPVVPPKNRCPASRDSPDYNATLLAGPPSPESQAVFADPRCDETYSGGKYGNSSDIWVGGEGDLAMILGRAPSSDAKRALANGDAISFYPAYLNNNQISIAWWSTTQLADKATSNATPTPVRTKTLDAVIDKPEHPIPFGIFLTPQTADAMGLDYKDSLVMASTTTMPTTAQSDALTAAISSLPDNREGQINAQIERGPQPFAAIWVWGLVGLSALIAIAAAAVAIGLARFDGRQDDATLSSLGAGRRIRRDFAFWQALVITGAGAVLGAGTGLIPALALSANTAMPFAPPWLQIAFTAVVLPLIIAAGNWLFTRSSRVFARRVVVA